MAWDLLFWITNAIALAGWLLLAALPRTERVLGEVLFAGVAVLCGIYLVLLVGLIGGLVEPGADAADAAFEYSVDGIKAMFATRGAIVVGWTHYLAFDLFIGLWIARDADSRAVGRLAQLPFLFATLMAGPVGLLAWLLLRKSLGEATPRAGGPVR